MNPLMLIAAVVLLPIVVLTVLRVNAAIVFLSLCLGAVLQRLAGKDASAFINLFTDSKGYTLSVLLLLLPVAFTTVIMVRTVKGGARTLLNLLPAASVGLVGLLLFVPLVSPGLQASITGTALWHDLERSQSLIVGASTLISLTFLLLQRPKHGGHRESRRH